MGLKIKIVRWFYQQRINSLSERLKYAEGVIIEKDKQVAALEKEIRNLRLIILSKGKGKSR